MADAISVKDESLPVSFQGQQNICLLERKFCCLCQAKICAKFLRDHLFSHFNYNPFKCRICYAEFSSERILNLHSISKHGDEEPALNFTEEQLDKFVEFVFEQCQNNSTGFQKLYPIYLRNKKLFDNLEYSSVLKMLKSNEASSKFASLNSFPVKPPIEMPSSHPTSPNISAEDNSTEKKNSCLEDISNRTTSPTPIALKKSSHINCAKCSKSIRKHKRKNHCLQHLPEKGLKWIYKCLNCTTQPFASLYRDNFFRLHILHKHGIENPQEDIDYIDVSKTNKYDQIMNATLKQCFPSL